MWCEYFLRGSQKKIYMYIYNKYCLNILSLNSLDKWDSQNLVNFNAGNTHCLILYRRDDNNFLDIFFGSSTSLRCDEILTFYSGLDIILRSLNFSPFTRSKLGAGLENGSHLWRVSFCSYIVIKKKI